MKINLFSTLVGYKRTNYIQLQVRLQLGTMGIKIIFDSSTKDVRSNLTNRIYNLNLVVRFT